MNDENIDTADASEADGVDLALSAAEEARAEALRLAHGDIRVLQVGDHLWCVRKPKRAEFLRFKVEQKHADMSVQVQAGEKLARACLVPFDAAVKVEDERLAFDQLGEDYPACPELLAQAVVGMAYGPFEFRVRKVSPSPASR